MIMHSSSTLSSAARSIDRRKYGHRRGLVVLLIVVYSAVISLRLFDNPLNYMIYWVDEWFPFNPTYAIYSSFSSWNWAAGTGGAAIGPPCVSDLYYLPYFTFEFLFHSLLGLNYGLSQYLLYVALISLGGSGMFFFASTIMKDAYGDSLVLPLVSGLLYVSSSYLVGPPGFGYVYNEFLSVIWLYMSLPFILYFLYEAVQHMGSGNFPLREAAIVFLLLYVASPSLQWVWLFTALSFLYLYLLLLYFLFRPRLRGFLALLALLTVVVALQNSALLVWAPGIAAGLPATTNGMRWMLYNSGLQPYFASMGDAYLLFPMGTVIMGDVLAIASFLSLLVRGGRNAKAFAAFFSGVALILIALMAGARPPFGGAFVYLWLHFLPFRTFRDLYMDFGYLLSLCYSLLLPLGLYALLRKRRAAEAAAVVFLVAWLAIGTPMLVNGQATAGWRVSPIYSNLPESLKASLPEAIVPLSAVDREVGLAGYLSNRLALGQRVLELPMQGPLIATQDYFATSILRQYGVQDISGTYLPGGDVEVYMGLAHDIVSNRTDDLARELAAFGVKYVLVRLNALPASVYWQPWPQNPLAEAEILNSTPGLRYVARAGPDVIYEVNYTYPLIYAAALPPGWQGNSSVYPFPEVPRIAGVGLRYQEISPTDFRVEVANATAPFILVLSTTYGGWSLGGASAKHVLVYDYANGWIVNGTGSFTLEIHYAGEWLVDWVLIAQMVGVLIPVAMLLWYAVDRSRSAKWRGNAIEIGEREDIAPGPEDDGRS